MPGAANTPIRVMQGIQVPATAVNKEAFFAGTRRLMFAMSAATNRAYGGLGTTDSVVTTPTGIVSLLILRVSGSLVVTPGTGSVASTSKWPYDLVRALRVTANGESNLINSPGIWLKARDQMARGNLVDRGVVQAIGGTGAGTARQQGTLALNSELWGVPQNASTLVGGTYPVLLEWVVPITMDERSLVGSIFAQTASTEISTAIDWAPQADLFVLAGNATVALSLNYTLEGIVYRIPEVGGQIVIPDLSAFHQFYVTRSIQAANGDNEILLTGQGVGKQLMRLGFKVQNGAYPGVPLPLNDTNYGPIGWRYGGNDTPELAASGGFLAMLNERNFGVDFATYQGMGILDFCSDFVQRDSIDEGSATALRLYFNIPAGVVLTSPATEYMQESVFAAAAGA